MKGSIHSDQVCPVCGSKFIDGKRSLFCPQHPKVSPTRFSVRYGPSIHKRFDSYEAAHQFLTGLRYQEGSGNFDVRDYQVKEKPLAFDRLAAEWLERKAQQIKACSLRSIRCGFARACEVWGSTNIKSISYAQLEDFFSAYPGAPKTRANILAAFKQFWAWAYDRYDVPPVKWPKIGHVEMAFRATVDILTQEAIINDIKEHEPFRVWLCIKWLATYIAIRPGEMRSLTEGQIDRTRGIFIIPHPKEKRAKIISLTVEDIEIVRALPLAFKLDTPFFRHETARGGGYKAGQQFGQGFLNRVWHRACARLGVQGVPIYPGTKHSTAMGLREVLSPEQIRDISGHSTKSAFERYCHAGGEEKRKSYEIRQTLVTAGNVLVTKNGPSNSSQIFNFTAK